MRVIGMMLVVFLVIGCGGEGTAPRSASSDPFEVRLVKGARWPTGEQVYSPELPGYHIVGDIASMVLRPKTGDFPERFVLAIETSPGERPNLESFTLTTSDLMLHTSYFDGTDYTEVRDLRQPDAPSGVTRVKKGTYFQFKVVGKEMHVIFRPKAVELLKKECTVSWIDWYRK